MLRLIPNQEVGRLSNHMSAYLTRHGASLRVLDKVRHGVPCVLFDIAHLLINAAAFNHTKTVCDGQPRSQVSKELNEV